MERLFLKAHPRIRDRGCINFFSCLIPSIEKRLQKRENKITNIDNPYLTAKVMYNSNANDYIGALVPERRAQQVQPQAVCTTHANDVLFTFGQ